MVNSLIGARLRSVSPFWKTWFNRMSAHFDMVFDKIFFPKKAILLQWKKKGTRKMTFGEGLKKLRVSQDLTQAQLAERIFVTRQTIRIGRMIKGNQN